MGKILYLLIMFAISSTAVYLFCNRVLFPFLNNINRKEVIENLSEISADNEVNREVKIHTHLENKQDEILNKLTKEN